MIRTSPGVLDDAWLNKDGNEIRAQTDRSLPKSKSQMVKQTQYHIILTLHVYR